MLPPLRPRQSARSGFTLAEVVVSLGLMAILFTAAFGTYFLGLRLLEDARHQLRASQIIQSEIERMRSLNWSTLQTIPATSSFFPDGEFVTQFAETYSASRTLNLTASGDQLLAKVTVSWTNSRGLATSASFSTVITRGGLSDYLYSIPPGD